MFILQKKVGITGWPGKQQATSRLSLNRIETPSTRRDFLSVRV